MLYQEAVSASISSVEVLGLTVQWVKMGHLKLEQFARPIQDAPAKKRVGGVRISMQAGSS